MQQPGAKDEAGGAGTAEEPNDLGRVPAELVAAVLQRQEELNDGWGQQGEPDEV